MNDGLLLDLAGRLHRGDRVLPWAPTTLHRQGAVPAQTQCGGDVVLIRKGAPVRADVVWRETTMEAHERQRGK